MSSNRSMGMHGRAMDGRHWIGGLVTSLGLLCTQPAHAHFKLLRPASWLNEDSTGGPQKGSPCGPGNNRPLFGDDVQPIPVSAAVTTFHAGETITVEWQETIYHPGYFRISIAATEAAAATTANFPDPPLTDLQDCHYDSAAVRTGPHDNVLADGLYMASGQEGANRSLKQDVKLPDAPCDRCTLQVVQVMEGHPGASCFYFHCAELTILPANGGAAGASGVAGASGMTGAGVAPASSPESSGCSVAAGGARSSWIAAWLLLALIGSLLYRAVRKSSASRLPARWLTVRRPNLEMPEALQDFRHEEPTNGTCAVRSRRQESAY